MQRLPFNIRPVVENILSTGTEADDIAKYSSASLRNVGNVCAWRCQKLKVSSESALVAPTAPRQTD